MMAIFADKTTKRNVFEGISLTVLPETSIFSPRPVLIAKRNHSGTKFGEVSERLKEHAWKVCIRQRIEGSNPSLTAKLIAQAIELLGLFYFLRFYVCHSICHQLLALSR